MDKDPHMPIIPPRRLDNLRKVSGDAEYLRAMYIQEKEKGLAAREILRPTTVSVALLIAPKLYVQPTKPTQRARQGSQLLAHPTAQGYELESPIPISPHVSSIGPYAGRAGAQLYRMG